MQNPSSTTRILKTILPILIVAAAAVLVWAFVFDAAGTDWVGDDEQVSSSPEPESSASDTQADVETEPSSSLSVYRGPVTIEQATGVSPVIVEVEVGDSEALRWSTESGEAPEENNMILLIHRYTPIEARVIRVFKGEDIPAQIRLKQFEEGFTVEGFTRVGEAGDRQIVFIFSGTEPSTGEVIWVVNDAWSIDGDMAYNEFVPEGRSLADIESEIVAAVGAPPEPLTFGSD